MNALPFDDWLKSYLAFRAEVSKILSQKVPNVPSELQRESQELEPLYFEAENKRADGLTHYYKAKTEKIDELHKQGFAVSALSELAKAASYKQLWAKENSEGVCNAIRDRKIKISQLMKLQGNP